MMGASAAFRGYSSSPRSACQFSTMRRQKDVPIYDDVNGGIRKAPVDFRGIAMCFEDTGEDRGFWPSWW